MDLRRVTARDGPILFAWRNDLSTYTYFVHPHPVSQTEHTGWLDRLLTEEGDRIGLIAEHQGRPVGVVRFDVISHARWEISLTVAPDSRGRGLGAAILSSAQEWVRSERGTWRTVVARIHPYNVASARLFVACGFREVSSDDLRASFLLYEWIV